MVIDKVTAAFGAIILIFAALSPAVARDRNLIVLNVGHSDFDDFDEPTVEANIEHSWARTIFGNGTWFSGVGPLIGLNITGKGGVLAMPGSMAIFSSATHLSSAPRAASAPSRRATARTSAAPSKSTAR